MRTPKALTLAEISRITRLTADEIRRFNPALTQDGAGEKQRLPAALRQRLRPRRLVLASADERRLRGGAGGLPPTRRAAAEWDNRAFDPV